MKRTIGALQAILAAMLALALIACSTPTSEKPAGGGDDTSNNNTGGSNNNTGGVTATPDPADAQYLFKSDGSAADISNAFDLWSSGTTFIEDFTADTTYDNAVKITSGTGWSIDAACVAFTAFNPGKLAEYTTLRFKVKTTDFSSISVKVPDAEKAYTLSSAGVISDGWVQFSVPLSDFMGAAKFWPAYVSQFAIIAYGTGSVLVTDVCLSGDTGTVTVEALSAEIANATGLNNAHAVGTADGNVSQDAKNALEAAIAAAQVLADTPPATQAGVTAELTTLITAENAFSAEIISFAPTAGADAPTLDASAVISLHTSSNTYTNISGITWNPGWGQAGTLTDFDISGTVVKKLDLKSNGSATYQGVDFGGARDITNKLHLHISYLTFNGTNLAVSPISVGQEYPIDVGTINADGNWHELSLDIDSTKVDITGIIQIKFTATSDQIYFLDNLYFY